jgi:hypothetical protein
MLAVAASINEFAIPVARRLPSTATRNEKADPEVGFRFPRSAGETGAGERSRTLDLLITNELLYQLSYTGVSAMPHKWDTAKPAILAQVFRG